MTVLTAQSPVGESRFQAYDLVRWLVGVVLLTAAAMKDYQLATGPVAETSLLTSRWFMITAVEFEWALGLCLVGGLWKRQTWWAAVVSFTIFACITAYKVWQGEASCGCFGKVEIDPRYTLGLDLVLLAALVTWRPRSNVPPIAWQRDGKTGQVQLNETIGPVPFSCPFSCPRISTKNRSDASRSLTGNMVAEPVTFIKRPPGAHRKRGHSHQGQRLKSPGCRNRG